MKGGGVRGGEGLLEAFLKKGKGIAEKKRLRKESPPQRRNPPLAAQRRGGHGGSRG